MFRTAAAGLKIMRENNLVHRDLKPQVCFNLHAGWFFTKFGDCCLYIKSGVLQYTCFLYFYTRNILWWKYMSLFAYNLSLVILPKTSFGCMFMLIVYLFFLPFPHSPLPSIYFKWNNSLLCNDLMIGKSSTIQTDA